MMEDRFMGGDVINATTLDGVRGRVKAHLDAALRNGA